MRSVGLHDLFTFFAIANAQQPIGHNTLSKMMANLCSKAGIKGFKTNNSLRTTTASRLYHNGIDEQLIMERTGHRRLDGVRSYKRTNEDQKIDISRTLQKSTSTATKTSTEEIENTCYKSFEK